VTSFSVTVGSALTNVENVMVIQTAMTRRTRLTAVSVY